MFRPRIGLEIHIRLLTSSKVFCPCPVRYGDEPNSLVCPVCLGYPGSLPVLNGEALRMACLLAHALNCSIAPDLRFDRKHYFYPDMPKNYQITQVSAPLGRDGSLELETGGGKTVSIRQLHLEEDAGKMIHRGNRTLLDYNRAGSPLVEIVTAPELETGEEAELLLRSLRRIVRYLGVCDGNMEEGSMRCDANVSVSPRGVEHSPGAEAPSGDPPGRKVEIKNLNSSRFVRLALDYETSRQREILRRGGRVAGETRLWNEAAGVTEAMRDKGESSDYRNVPKTDLPPFPLDPEYLEGVKRQLVELPSPRKRRLVRDYGLSGDAADFLTEEKDVADFFERAAALGADPRTAASWLRSEVRRILNRENLSLGESPLTEKRLVELLGLVREGGIGGGIARKTLEEVFRTGRDPAEIVRERGWEPITRRDALLPVVEKILAAHPKAARELREGKDRALDFLTGMALKETAGRADPGLVKALISDVLKEGRG